MSLSPADYLPAFADFLDASPTSYHAAARAGARLAEAGYAVWTRGGPAPASGYAVRDGAVAAWRTPAGWTPADGLCVVAGHTDSPGLKLKPDPVLSAPGGYAQIGVEVYGGPLLATWFDRELAVAGRAVNADGVCQLVQTDAIARVPSLAPHLGGPQFPPDRQQHIQPVLALLPGLDVLDLVAAQLAWPREELVGADLFCVPVESAQFFGPHGDFLAAARLDNLSSVYAALAAFLDQRSEGRALSLFVAFDHEEVGSLTATGANGPWLGEIVQGIGRGLELGEDGLAALWAAATCVSADAAQGFHPNYPEVFDPVCRPVLGGGPVLKANAGQRYVSDGVGAALWQRACQAAGVPVQAYVNRNTVSGGGTIGAALAARWGIAVVDVGIPLLSMHSARELCATPDPLWLAEALAAYWAGA